MFVFLHAGKRRSEVNATAAKYSGYIGTGVNYLERIPSSVMVV